jgi:hypothetical protein
MAKSADVRPFTLDRYRASLGHFLRFVGERATVRAALTSDQVQGLKGARRRSGAAEETVNKDLIAVSVLASYCRRKGWLAERPVIERFPTRIRIRYLEPHELELYLAAVRPRLRPLFEAKCSRSACVTSASAPVRRGRSLRTQRAPQVCGPFSSRHGLPPASKNTSAARGCEARIGCFRWTAGRHRTNTTAPAGSRGSWATRSTTTGTLRRSTSRGRGCRSPNSRSSSGTRRSP